MFHRLRGLVALIALVLAVPAAAGAADEPPGLPVQLELGDSWTYGDTASDPATAGYAGLVHASNLATLDCVPGVADEAADHCRQLQRVTLARKGTAANPGVTTVRLIDEQLAGATALLRERNGDRNPRNDVEVILLTVGGNDLSRPVLAACLGGLTPECVGVIAGGTARVEANLQQILGSLRAAAGPDTRIVIGTYANALTHCPIGQQPGASALGDLVLEGHPALGIRGLNGVIRSVAAGHDVRVADLFGRLGPGDWTGDCLHPNDAGYRVIADVFRDQLVG